MTDIPDSLGDLTAQEVAAITALMTEPTIEQAAERVGVSARTLSRWLARDDFRTAYRSALRTTFEHANARLQNAGAKAVRTLEAVMDDEEAPAAARVSAARAVLEAGARDLELTEVVDRLDSLEQRIAANPHGRRMT